MIEIHLKLMIHKLSHEAHLESTVIWLAQRDCCMSPVWFTK